MKNNKIRNFDKTKNVEERPISNFDLEKSNRLNKARELNWIKYQNEKPKDDSFVSFFENLEKEKIKEEKYLNEKPKTFEQLEKQMHNLYQRKGIFESMNSPKFEICELNDYYYLYLIRKHSWVDTCDLDSIKNSDNKIRQVKELCEEIVDFLEKRNVKFKYDFKSDYYDRSNVGFILHIDKFKDLELNLEKMKMKELIEELGNSIVSNEDTLKICEAIQNKIENGKGLKEENYESLKSFYKEFVKDNNNNISSDNKKIIKETKEIFKNALEELNNNFNFER